MRLICAFLFCAGIHAELFRGLVEEGGARAEQTGNRISAAGKEFMSTRSESYGRRTTSGDLLSRPGFHLIRMPDMHAQQEYNTCGTHSMARYLKHIGFRVNWNAFLERATDRSLFKPFATTDVTGTTPNSAKSFLRNYNPNFRLVENSTSAQILQNLSRNRPVMVLIRVGSSANGAVPAMHWITLVGYDSRRRIWYYYDTNGNNIYQTSWTQFRQSHHFSRNYAALDFALKHLADVQPGSMIYCGPSAMNTDGTCRARTMR